MKMTKTQTIIAREIATLSHKDQFRWDGKTPYIAHPAAVAKAVADNWDPDFSSLKDYAVAAAWLHDVVEDCPVSLTDLTKAEICPLVCSVVDILTKRDNDNYLSYLLRVKADYMACRIKIEDIKHNMSDLDRTRKKSMYEKYQLALYILGERTN